MRVRHPSAAAGRGFNSVAVPVAGLEHALIVQARPQTLVRRKASVHLVELGTSVSSLLRNKNQALRHHPEILIAC